MALRAIIAASGMGIRQSPISRTIPKAMLPAGNLRLIDFSIRSAKSLGMDKLYCGVGKPPLSVMIERHVTQKDIFGIEIQTHTEPKLLHTAGTVKYLLPNFNQNDTIAFFPCDTPNNIKAETLLRALKEAEQQDYAMVIFAYAVEWSAREWEQRSFGTIEVEGMPRLRDFPDRNNFELSLRAWENENREGLFKVQGFHEKEVREQAQSNLINSGIYFMKAGLMMDLAPYITPIDDPNPYCDFGYHIIPSLTPNRLEEFSSRAFYSALAEVVRKGKYPIYTYILPPDVYWRDVHNPRALLDINMDILAGRLSTGIEQDPGQFWKKVEWGYQGMHSTDISKTAKIDSPLTNGGGPQGIGSLIGNHVSIGSGAEVKDCVMLDYLNFSGTATDSVFFPSLSENWRNIGKGINITNSLYINGELNDRTPNVPKRIVGSIIMEAPNGGYIFELINPKPR